MPSRLYRARNCRLFGPRHGAATRDFQPASHQLPGGFGWVVLDSGSAGFQSLSQNRSLGPICIPHLGDGPRLTKKGTFALFPGQDLRTLDCSGSIPPRRRYCCILLSKPTLSVITLGLTVPSLGFVAGRYCNIAECPALNDWKPFGGSVLLRAAPASRFREASAVLPFRVQGCGVRFEAGVSALCL